VIVPHAIVRAFVPDRYDNEAKAPRIAVPVLVVHGTDDRLVPFSMGEHLARLFPNGELLRIVGAHHNDLYEVDGLRIADAITRIANGGN
jgi:pimeloyl-ACP methyl ester carboxylesterase